VICCDTCPYWPTCEERDDWLRDALGLDEEAIADQAVPD